MKGRQHLFIVPAALSVVLLGAAAPPKPAPPPEVGVKAMSAGGARRIDAVLPGKVLATAFPRGADGKRRVLALVAPTPDGPRELYLVDISGAGSEKRLLGDLSAKASFLTAEPLNGEHAADEILLGAPGQAWSLGTVGSPTPPHRILEGADLRHLLVSGNRDIATAEVGRLRSWTREGSGALAPGESAELPVRATRERTALRLDTPEVEVLAQDAGAPPIYLVGPEANGKTRLHTLMITRDAEGNPQRTESWSRFAGPESVEGHWFVRVDGRPMLIVTSTGAEKVSLFEEQSLRVFPLTADRSRAGQPPVLAVPTASRRWFPARPFILDADKDGHDDLVVVQQEGLRGKALIAEIWFGQGNGRFASTSRKVSLGVQAHAWDYGTDVTGDGHPDLVAIEQNKLLVFPGTTDPKRDLLDHRPRLSLDLPASGPMSVSVGAGSAGTNVESSHADSLRMIDLDGDGRAEIVVTVRDTVREGNGRGRVTVVRVGG